jgi:hypothetical protein
MSRSTPLWQILESAFLAGRSPGYSDRNGYAEEIRALADWLVPEEEALNSHPERERLRRVLLSQADIAEKADEQG